jgi:hypothetical protein
MSKGETLLFLQNSLNLSMVPKSKILVVKDLLLDFEAQYRDLLIFFGTEKIAIRSSHMKEDQISDSSAGKFYTSLNLNLADKKTIQEEILKVIASYRKSYEKIGDQQVLFQIMVKDVNCSGVLFTQNQVDGSPYYVINYDDESGKTDTITGGKRTNSNRILYIYHKQFQKLNSLRFSNLIKSTIEIQKFYKKDNLDIEFAIDSQDRIMLLQVRPLYANKWSKEEKEIFHFRLMSIFDEIRNRQSEKKDAGYEKIWGMMPDWNPVELIGRKPKNLAYEIFHKSITKTSWATARKNMAYKDQTNFELTTKIGGTPYVDIEQSIRSLIPKDISAEIENKMVCSSLHRLKQDPSLHDKFEFEVVISAPCFDIENRINHIYGKDLSYLEKKELAKAIWSQFWLNYSDWEAVEYGVKFQINSFTKNQLNILGHGDFNSAIKVISNSSSVVFSEVARYAFISTELLKSLLRKNHISDFDLQNFYGSLNSISNSFLNDIFEYKNNRLSKSYLVTKYGHLRPGTFDIEIPPYRSQFDYFDSHNSEPPIKNEVSEKQKISTRSKIVNAVRSEFEQLGILEDPNKFFDFLISSIQSRELAKFYLSKNISILLDRITDLGFKNGVIPAELAHSSLLDLDQLFSGKLKIFDFIKNIYIRKEEHALLTKIKTPELITQPESILIVPYQGGTPNFVSTKVVKGIIRLNPSPEAEYFTNSKLPNILVLESADPGHDWIFTRNIGGLITRFGGANSHMAIRCSEFAIPAIIGCGEKLFEKISKSKIVEINCFEQKVTVNE